MSGIVVVQQIIDQNFAVKLNGADCNRIWLGCVGRLIAEQQHDAYTEALHSTDGVVSPDALEAIMNAISHTLIQQPWPRYRTYGNVVDAFPSLMRDAMRRRGYAVPSPRTQALAS